MQEDDNWFEDNGPTDEFTGRESVIHGVLHKTQKTPS